MSCCRIISEEIPEGTRYICAGLQRLNARLTDIQHLPYRGGPGKRIQKVRWFERPVGTDKLLIKPLGSRVDGAGRTALEFYNAGDVSPAPGTGGPGTSGAAPRWQSERAPLQTEPLVSLKVQTRWVQSDVLGYSGFIVPPGQAVANRYKTYLHQTESRDEKGLLLSSSNHTSAHNTGSRTAHWEACWTGIGYRSDSGSESGDVIRGPLSSPSSPRSKSTIQFNQTSRSRDSGSIGQSRAELLLEGEALSISKVYSYK